MTPPRLCYLRVYFIDNCIYASALPHAPHDGRLLAAVALRLARAGLTETGPTPAARGCGRARVGGNQVAHLEAS